MEDGGKTAGIPLLDSGAALGTTSTVQTLANIVVSIVGTGVLGLPFALRIAGWLAGSLGIIVAGLATYYCMLLLVKCRDKLASEEEEDSTNRKTYGDLGYESMGTTDIQQALGGEFSFKERTAITSNIGGLPFAGGMAVFCFEGFGMTLALEGSMRDKRSFPKLLAQAFTGITLLYVLFGFFGYMAYGDETRDIVTLNLPRDWWALAVQIGMCLGLVFTFPIMVHPINEIIEGRLKKSNWFQDAENTNGYSTTSIGKFGIYLSRSMLVIGLAILASCVPAFGVFASLVGSTVCALISFVLPAIFHLKIFWSSLNLWQRALDFVILSCGMLFAAYGTYNTVVGV
ncbi:amino acid transporter ANT1 isoform X2 [Morus notabilis]|uniref:amino acid transporter ANT1 isoform X2 n=1 Tax=Morus notabilis TaxID=981085 RepID=UPI000CED2127|nr:amino acid transporter ANT1 isoform X2 [Morus notabilis]